MVWLIIKVNSTLKTPSCHTNTTTALHSHLQDSYFLDHFYGMMVFTTLSWQITNQIWRFKYYTVGSKKSIFLDGLEDNKSEGLKSVPWCLTADLFIKMFLNLIHQRLFFLFLNFCKTRINSLNKLSTRSKTS